MTTAMIRVPRATPARLLRLAEEANRPVGQVIDALLNEREKRSFFDGLAADFQRLREDPAAAAEYDAETRLWESTLSDGLGDSSDR